jgi:hypothetical protein
LKRIIIAAVVVVAVVAVVYFTKPGPPERPPDDQASAGETLDIPSYRAPTAIESNDGGPTADAGAPTAASVPVTKHGKNAVVRSQGDDSGKLKVVERKRYPADWDNPHEVPFRVLKKLRREFRQQGDFNQDTARQYSGAAVRVRGAVMPIDPVGEEGLLKRFWIANTIIVMAGCVFCFPPTMGDLVYVDAGSDPYEVDREQLYRSIVKVEALGRLELGPNRSADGVEYMFGLELKEISD